MSCDAHAFGIIGFELYPSKCFSLMKVKAFEHSFPEDWAVDPKSGKPLWTEQWVSNELITVKYKGEDPESCKPSLGAYNIFVNMNRYDNIITHMFVGLSIDVYTSNCGSNYLRLDPVMLAQVKQDLSKYKDLFLGDAFGLHLIAKLSC